MLGSSLPLALTLELRISDLEVRMLNPTDQPVRVWQPGNSWGGASWSLHLAAGSGQERILRPGKQPYTLNLPRFTEVPPFGHRGVRLAPGGLDWTFGEDLSALREVALAVRVVLDIAASADATAQRVATGRGESGAVMSQPPHRWLFGR